MSRTYLKVIEVRCPNCDGMAQTTEVGKLTNSRKEIPIKVVGLICNHCGYGEAINKAELEQVEEQ